jgi:3-deoxy-manno-octulosonate cytidylyltransferase (CMP-KDO synthetase)
MKDLEITHYYEGISNKLEVLSELTAMLGIELSEVAFVGDDALDLPALESVGLAVTPPDAHPLARAKAHYETMAAGGAGAVREVADLVLHAAGRLERAVHALSNNTLAGAFGVIIPARYASSRLPGKPLLRIAGRPMLLHVCDNAKASGAGYVLVATDDERIVDVARAAGIDAVLTSRDHESGTDRLAEVARARGFRPDDIVVNVQGDEPLLAPEHIRTVALALCERRDAGMATLATALESAAQLTNPNLVKVVLNGRGYAQYFSRAGIPFRRDDAISTLPGLRALRHIGVYAYRTRALLRVAEHPPTDHERSERLEQLRALWLGIPIHVSLVDNPPEHGVDTEADLQRVDGLLSVRP